MKRMVYALLAVVLLTLTACGREPNTLFDRASPETSVMTIWRSDAKGTDEYQLPDDEAERELLEKLKNTQAVPAEATPANVTLPIFGLNIGVREGFDIWVAWSNGYLYDRDGMVYRFDFDFEALLKRDDLEHEEHYDQQFIPNERLLVLGKDGWDTTYMTPSEEPVPPHDVTLEAVYEGGKIQARFHNHGTERWNYGTYYSLDVKLGERWYRVPTATEKNWGFPDVEYTIPAGEPQERTYQLEMYGELPSGRYRFVAFGLVYEFDVK